MNDRKSPLGIWVGVALAAVLAAPPIYVLLLGPLYYLSLREIVAPGIFEAAMEPLRIWDSFFGRNPEWLWEAWGDYTVWWFELAVD